MSKLTPEQLAAITQRSRLRLDNGDTPALLDHIKALEEENARLKSGLTELRVISLDETKPELWRLARIDNEIKHLTKGDSNQ